MTSFLLRRPSRSHAPVPFGARVRRHWFLALPLLFSPMTTSSAQSLADQTRQLAPDGPGRIISANPFLPLLGLFAAEYEQRLTPAVALAISGSHIKPNDTRYTNGDFKARLYPTERGLHGFNMAASVGVARIRKVDNLECDPAPCVVPKAFATGSFAIELGYQWMLGPSRVTVVSVGGGAKRYLGSDDKFGGINRVMPTLRLNIGYAF